MSVTWLFEILKVTTKQKVEHFHLPSCDVFLSEMHTPTLLDQEEDVSANPDQNTVLLPAPTTSKLMVKCSFIQWVRLASHPKPHLILDQFMYKTPSSR